MEVLAATLGVSLIFLLLVAVVLSLLVPAFWLWMLIDAIVRDPETFPSRDSAEKIVWVVVMLVLQPLAAAFFLLVWWPQHKAAASVVTTAVAVPAA